ncbi:MAG: rhodanese-like domain-containing protein [Pyrinomonadaceae bacterium]|nr:rhodanese-like domain-containing protein [Pyrinomonadaceae bacterium]
MNLSPKLVGPLAVLALSLVVACQQAVPFKKFANDSEVPRMTLAEAKKAFDEGKAVFVDSRGDAAYKAEHIAGSINIPYDGKAPNLDSLPKGKKIIVYCS